MLNMINNDRATGFVDSVHQLATYQSDQERRNLRQGRLSSTSLRRVSVAWLERDPCDTYDRQDTTALL